MFAIQTIKEDLRKKTWYHSDSQPSIKVKLIKEILGDDLDSQPSIKVKLIKEILEDDLDSQPSIKVKLIKEILGDDLDSQPSIKVKLIKEILEDDLDSQPSIKVKLIKEILGDDLDSQPSIKVKLIKEILEDDLVSEPSINDELKSENCLYYYDVVTNTKKRTNYSIVDNKCIIADHIEIIENVADTFKVINSNLLSIEALDNIKKTDNLSYQKKRFFHSGISLQLVIDQTPQYVDFFNGKSYTHLHKKILPRFINKNKPREVWGNFWGKRYGVLYKDNITSWNFPILNEFFANYGLKGVVIGMFLFGIFIKTIIITLPLNSNNAVIFSGVSTIIFSFFYQELNLSMLLGKMINYSTFFGLIFISILIANYFFERIYSVLKK